MGATGRDEGDGRPRPALTAWRFALGVLLAPFTPSLVMTPLALIYAGGGQGLKSSYALLVTWVEVSAVFTVPATLVLGLPLFFVFRWRGWTYWRQFALGGGALGLIVLVYAPPLVFLACGVLSGSVAALTLWLSAYGERRALKLAGAAGLLCVLLLLAASL